jgi:hypothetical protein
LGTSLETSSLGDYCYKREEKGELDKELDQVVGGHYPVLINKPLYDVIGNKKHSAA